MDQEKENYTDVDVWKQDRILSKEVYLVSSNFPIDKKFGLISQIRKAAVSIPSDIAEGCGRNRPKGQHSIFLSQGVPFMRSKLNYLLRLIRDLSKNRLKNASA